MMDRLKMRHNSLFFYRTIAAGTNFCISILLICYPNPILCHLSRLFGLIKDLLLLFISIHPYTAKEYDKQRQTLVKDVAVELEQVRLI